MIPTDPAIPWMQSALFHSQTALLRSLGRGLVATQLLQFVPDLDNCLQGRDQFLAQAGQLVFDRWRRCRADMAHEHTAVLQFGEARGQDLGRDRRNVAFEFIEAARTGPQELL